MLLIFCKNNMDNYLNRFEESPNFSDIYDFSSDFPQEISNENETPSFSYSLSDLKCEYFNLFNPPKKNLFKTKKIKTSLVIFKLTHFTSKKTMPKLIFLMAVGLDKKE